MKIPTGAESHNSHKSPPLGMFHFFSFLFFPSPDINMVFLGPLPAGAALNLLPGAALVTNTFISHTSRKVHYFLRFPLRLQRASAAAAVVPPSAVLTAEISPALHPNAAMATVRVQAPPTIPMPPNCSPSNLVSQ